MPIYWSIHQFPSLRDRPPAERQAVVQAALKAARGAFGVRLLVVFASVVAGAIAATLRISPRAPMLDWRTWIAPACGALFIYVYLLVEINGTIHTAVKRYVTDKNAQKNPKKK
jgi:fructose-specific phosphotransferase system IIC component